MKRSCFVVTSLVLGVFLAAVPALAETVNVTVDPAKPWVGWMNVFDAPGGTMGGYLWGSAWGTADLAASFAGANLRLSPNTNCYNAADAYWVNPDGTGAKYMDANIYVEDTSLVGKTIAFGGQTLSNTFVPAYSSKAFIKVLDPAQGWATILSVFADLPGGQPFSLSLDVPNTAGLVPQYGFVTDGLVANPATVNQLGAVVLTAPEPASLLALGLLILGCRRR
jgi:hypothetical protein